MLRKAALATIAYYDALEYPLTEFEVWKHLVTTRDDPMTGCPILGQVAAALDGLVHDRVVSRCQGFVILPGREALIQERIRSEKYSVPKIKRATRLVRFIAWVPFVRLIALTGSLSMKYGDRDSDWDLFVVLRQGAIWRGRTALSLVLQLMGKRRHGQHIENRACLNHFVTDGSLEITMQDYFSASEYRFMYTLFGRETERRFELANRWMARIKPTYQPTVLPNHWLRPVSRFQSQWQQWLERALDWPGYEAYLSRWQRGKIARNPKTQTPGAFIIATDEALIFLPHPKGPVVFDRFKERLTIHGLSA
ncbi:MAG: hypothetical protein IPJ68_01600 [Candidatus Moraniibacteriota bacterium]|nr:MAG: hypothetical protein IPJ68_01600 [Candidatus Moranbacteria bacterium]